MVISKDGSNGRKMVGSNPSLRNNLHPNYIWKIQKSWKTAEHFLQSDDVVNELVRVQFYQEAVDKDDHYYDINLYWRIFVEKL